MNRDNKKIMFFTGFLKEGGAERVISIVSRQLVDDGYDVEILMYRDDTVFYAVDPGVKLTFLERETGSRNIFRNIIWLRRYLKKSGRTILSFLAPYNMLLLAANIGLGNKVIAADRNDPRFIPKKKIMRGLRNLLYNLADAVVVQTENNKKYFSRRIREKCSVIYNPVDLGEYRGCALKSEKRREIVSVCRLIPHKNLQMLIRAFGRVHTKHPDYSLVICGDGPVENELKKLISDMGLGDAVVMAGKIQNVPEKIRGCEIFASPSNFEGMSNSLIEAMCVGLPCVSTRVSGAVDLIEDHVNGVLIDVGSGEQMESALNELIENSELRESIAERAAGLNGALSPEKITRQWEKVIAAVTGGA